MPSRSSSWARRSSSAWRPSRSPALRTPGVPLTSANASTNRGLSSASRNTRRAPIE